MICFGLLNGIPSRADDAVPALPPPAQKQVDYARDIQPILASRCYRCHGQEGQEGGLRLHRKAAALAGGDSGAALVAGKSAESLLIQYVTGLNDNETIMPPEGEGERLTTEQVALLRAWIDQGIAWPASADPKETGPRHWSFEPIADPPLPTVKRTGWMRNGIDQFVLARLESLGIEPSSEADRVTLIRRLYFDLLGLLPTPAEVDAFVSDERSDAYERLVDRLLASPHYGERWGRHWLDLARYADSDGYEKDTTRPFAWRWRNWVIDALNRDLPFNQFTIEQLAGDLLPQATLDQRIATGFHRNTLVNKEGGVDQEEFRVKATVDRLNTTGAVWLGLTIGCAQCHTHKYDPITHREFYGMFAFFNSLVDQDIPAPLPEQLAAYEAAKEAFDREHAPLVAAVKKYEQEQLPARLVQWEKTFSVPHVEWTALEPQKFESAANTDFKKQTDHSLLATTRKVPDKDTYTFTFTTSLENITAIRLEALSDPSLPGKGPGRTKQGNFVLTELRATVRPLDGKSAPQPVTLENASADFAQGKDQAEFPPSAALDSKPQTGWAVSPQFGKSHAAVFQIKQPFGSSSGMELVVTLEQQYGGQHVLGRPRISVTNAARPVSATGVPDDVAAALAIDANKRSKQQQTSVAQYYRQFDPELAKLDAAVAAHAKKAPVDPATTTKAQALVEMEKPRETHVMIRGDFLRPGAEVSPQTLSVLPPLPTTAESPTRLDLARWLVNGQNPLTARVTVNRYWQAYFGRGLVATPDDFGKQGQPPSHPQLLDWLATQFQRDWSIKGMHRLIVTSATYRQSSAARPELAERDPQNIYLARQVRFRVEAEVIRDVFLSAAGLLNPAVGGPSVRPPQPTGISELTYAGAARWVESKGPDRYRRGMYTHFQRTSPYPMLMTFDAPDSNVCVVKRERSNTPLQALTLLNDTVFFECAQGLGRRIVTETDDSDSLAKSTARIRHGFRLCLSREPSALEMERLEQLYQTFLAACQADPQAAARMIGDKKPDGIDTSEVAAWTAVARTMMNLDEFVTRE
jgi:mono/diheme cytochrome c family protein